MIYLAARPGLVDRAADFAETKASALIVLPIRGHAFPDSPRVRQDVLRGSDSLTDVHVEHRRRLILLVELV